MSFKTVDMSSDFPLLIRIMDYILKVLYIGYYVLIYSISLRYWHLQAAAKFIKELDESLKTSTDISFSVKLRIYIGFAIVLLLVIFNSLHPLSKHALPAVHLPMLYARNC